MRLGQRNRVQMIVQLFLVPSIKKMRSFVKLETVHKYKMYANVCDDLSIKSGDIIAKLNFVTIFSNAKSI